MAPGTRVTFRLGGGVLRLGRVVESFASLVVVEEAGSLEWRYLRGTEVATVRTRPGQVLGGGR